MDIRDADVSFTELSVDADRFREQYGHKKIDSEHLLLASLITGNQRIREYFIKKGVSTQDVGKKIDHYLKRKYKQKSSFFEFNLAITKECYYIIKGAIEISEYLGWTNFNDISALYAIVNRYKIGNNSFLSEPINDMQLVPDEIFNDLMQVEI